MLARYRASTASDWQSIANSLLSISYLIGGMEAAAGNGHIAGTLIGAGHLIKGAQKVCTMIAIYKQRQQNEKENGSN